MENEPAPARELLESALAMGLAAEDRWSQGQANLYLGILAESSADPQAASSFFREAVECMGPYRDSTLLPVALVGQASVMARRDPATALRVVAAGYAVRARSGGEFAPYFKAFAERARAAATQGVASDADRLWSDGSRLSADDAIALAFATRRPRTSHALGVTKRELDVVRLVSEGRRTRRSRGGCTSWCARSRRISATSGPRRAWRTAPSSLPGHASAVSRQAQWQLRNRTDFTAGTDS